MRTGIADSIKCEKKHEKNQKFRREKEFLVFVRLGNGKITA